jgi:hypothetical protein
VNRLRKFVLLARRDRVLLVRAGLLMSAVRLGLWTLSFATVRSLLIRLGGSRVADMQTTNAARIVWAVETVGRHMPMIGTCLIQALAAHVLLARAGFESNLGIGVTRRDGGEFTAHAWLEREGTFIIGGTHAKQFVPLPVLKGLRP